MQWVNSKKKMKIKVKVKEFNWKENVNICFLFVWIARTDIPLWVFRDNVGYNELLGDLLAFLRISVGPSFSVHWLFLSERVMRFSMKTWRGIQTAVLLETLSFFPFLHSVFGPHRHQNCSQDVLCRPSCSLRQANITNGFTTCCDNAKMD